MRKSSKLELIPLKLKQKSLKRMRMEMATSTLFTPWQISGQSIINWIQWNGLQ
jgi:hypothetical protein